MSEKKNTNDSQLDVVNGILQSSTGLAGIAVALFTLVKTIGIPLPPIVNGIFIAVVFLNLLGSWFCLRILLNDFSNSSTNELGYSLQSFRGGIVLLGLGFLLLAIPQVGEGIFGFLGWIQSWFAAS